MPIFEAAFAARRMYLDLAMSLSAPGLLLGQEQLDQHERWADAGLLALVGIGVEPGLSDVFAPLRGRRAVLARSTRSACATGRPRRRGLRLRADVLDLDDDRGVPEPAAVWERDRGWYTTEPFSEPEVFEFPEGIGPVECVNVEHEEVVLVPRWVDCRRVTFKYGLGEEFIDVLKTLHRLGLDSKEPVRVRESRWHRATSSRPRCPTRPRSATA
jgi:saccharopine dehydrogenase-like NADP-dependent oxidoreductase